MQDVKLPELLANPVTVEIVKDWLLKHLSAENVAILMDIQRFKALSKSVARRSFAQEIFATFIQDGSRYEVNLSGTLKRKIAEAMKGKIGHDLFDDVEKEIMALVTTNTMDAFSSSPMFKLCCAILGHPSYLLKHKVRPVLTVPEPGRQQSDVHTEDVRLNEEKSPREMSESYSPILGTHHKHQRSDDLGSPISPVSNNTDTESSVLGTPQNAQSSAPAATETQMTQLAETRPSSTNEQPANTVSSNTTSAAELKITIQPNSSSEPAPAVEAQPVVQKPEPLAPLEVAAAPKETPPQDQQS
jgi:hypothetical protein